jgi:magnesium transporter
MILTQTTLSLYSGQHLPTFLALANVYGLHHLEVEDAMGVNERPRVVRHEDRHLQIMLQMIRAKKKAPLRLKDEQVSIFIVKNTVITCQEKLTATFTVPLQRRLPDPGSKLRQNGADFLAYSIIDLVVDQASIQVMRFNRDLMSLERRVHSKLLHESLQSRVGA